MGEEPEALRRRLTGTWYRSHEEDDDGSLVFRSGDYAFPPARAPRPALRLRPDGTAEALRPGPVDRPIADRPIPDPSGRDPARGRWALQERTLSLRTPQLSGSFTVEVLDDDRLVVRRRPDRDAP